MTKPWYRERWPWLLMAGPAAVLGAGAGPGRLAVAAAAGVVAEDVYKQGLAINRVLAREEAARRLGLASEIRLEGGTLTVMLEGARPEALFVHLVHATRAGYDVRLRLAPTETGAYAAALPPMPPGRWRIAIEDPRGSWRIVKEAS